MKIYHHILTLRQLLVPLEAVLVVVLVYARILDAWTIILVEQGGFVLRFACAAIT